ncbi:MBL fold metallo-hydrolase [Dermatophilus congolensis]|nr:MBL fold metallo-hydrolase [Dermatophilus congolensis]
MGFSAQAFGTNCFVVAPDKGEECLVIDPGFGVEGQLREVVDRYRLRPVGLLATHGHLDHTYSLPVLSQQVGAPVRIHGADRYRLADPALALSADLLSMVEQQLGFGVQWVQWVQPQDVVEVDGGQVVSLAGLEFEVVHAPGHTEGSVLFRFSGVPQGLAADVEVDHTIFSGDVLFAGSIGRTDLPGGDGQLMQRTLREIVLAQSDSGLVLPGHGPATTIGHERLTNPYLQGLHS